MTTREIDLVRAELLNSIEEFADVCREVAEQELSFATMLNGFVTDKIVSDDLEGGCPELQNFTTANFLVLSKRQECQQRTVRLFVEFGWLRQKAKS